MVDSPSVCKAPGESRSLQSQTSVPQSNGSWASVSSRVTKFSMSAMLSLQVSRFACDALSFPPAAPTYPQDPGDCEAAGDSIESKPVSVEQRRPIKAGTETAPA